MCVARLDETLHIVRGLMTEERKHRFPVPPTVDDVLQANLTGDEAAVRDRIDQWAEAGADTVVIQPMPPIEGTRFFGERNIHHYG